MTSEEQQLITDLQNRVLYLEQLLSKDNYSNLQVFRKQVQFKSLVDFKNQPTGLFTKQSAITPPTGAGTAGVDNPARTAINTIITTLQTLGLTN